MVKKKASGQKALSQHEQQELFESILTRSGAKLPDVRGCIALFHRQENDSVLEGCLKDADLEFVMRHLLVEAKKFNGNFAESAEKVRDACAELFMQRKLADEERPQEGDAMDKDPEGVNVTIGEMDDEGTVLRIGPATTTDEEAGKVTLVKKDEPKKKPVVGRAPKPADSPAPAPVVITSVPPDNTDGDAETALATHDDLPAVPVVDPKAEPARTEATATAGDAVDKDPPAPRGKTPTEMRADGLAGAGITPESIEAMRRKVKSDAGSPKPPYERADSGVLNPTNPKSHDFYGAALGLGGMAPPPPPPPAPLPDPASAPEAETLAPTPPAPEPAATAPKPEPPPVPVPKKPWWKKRMLLGDLFRMKTEVPTPSPKADDPPKAKSGSGKTPPTTGGRFKPLPPPSPAGKKKVGRESRNMLLGLIAMVLSGLFCGLVAFDYGKNRGKTENANTVKMLPPELAKGKKPTPELLKGVVNGSGTADCFKPKTSWEDLFPKSPPSGNYVSCNLAHAPLTGCAGLDDMDCECHVIRECVVIAAN